MNVCKFLLVSEQQHLYRLLNQNNDNKQSFLEVGCHYWGSESLLTSDNTMTIVKQMASRFLHPWFCIVLSFPSYWKEKKEAEEKGDIIPLASPSEDRCIRGEKDVSRRGQWGTKIAPIVITAQRLAHSRLNSYFGCSPFSPHPFFLSCFIFLFLSTSLKEENWVE